MFSMCSLRIINLNFHVEVHNVVISWSKWSQIMQSTRTCWFLGKEQFLYNLFSILDTIHFNFAFIYYKTWILSCHLSHVLIFVFPVYNMMRILHHIHLFMESVLPVIHLFCLNELSALLWRQEFTPQFLGLHFFHFILSVNCTSLLMIK